MGGQCLPLFSIDRENTIKKKEPVIAPEMSFHLLDGNQITPAATSNKTGPETLSQAVLKQHIDPVASFVLPVTRKDFGSEVKWERFLVLTLTKNSVEKKKTKTTQKNNNRNNWDELISVRFRTELRSIVSILMQPRITFIIAS